MPNFKIVKLVLNKRYWLAFGSLTIVSEVMILVTATKIQNALS